MYHKEVNMIWEGDGPEGQPTEGVATLDSLAMNMDEGDDALGDEPEDEDGEEPEGVEGDDGDEPDESEEDSDEDDEGSDPTVTLKHDGKEIEVKLSEALNLAQQGYDYSKKTMAVAEERKAVEAERSRATDHFKAAEKVNSEAIARLEAYTKFMESQVGAPPSAELLSHDTHAYLVQKEQYEARRGQLGQAYEAVQALRNEQERQRQSAITEKAVATEKVLKDTLPGWNDETLDTLAGYAATAGLTPQTASDAFLEPGFWTLAHKAQAYDALMAEKSRLKPVNKLPKVSKPQAGNQPPQLARRQDAMRRHKANPSMQTLVDLL